MASATDITKGTVNEDSGASFMARIYGNDGAVIVQASISSIAYKVFNFKTSKTAPVSEGALTVSSVVFDTLQTDARWTEDSTGYNFRWDAPATIFTTGGDVYLIEIKFTPASGAVFHKLFEVKAIGVYGS